MHANTNCTVFIQSCTVDDVIFTTSRILKLSRICCIHFKPLHTIEQFISVDLIDEDNEDCDDPIDDINIEDSGNEMSSGNVDQCPVCLMSLKEQLLGTPNNCPHVFCFDCIQEWSKVRIGTT